MTSRRKWTLVPAFFAIATAATLLSAYSGASSSQGFSPVQPVQFPHPGHVQTLGMNCLYWHYSANKSPDPGLPAVGTCMGCHTVVGPNRPAMDGKPARVSAEITKLQKLAPPGQPQVACAPGTHPDGRSTTGLGQPVSSAAPTMRSPMRLFGRTPFTAVVMLVSLLSPGPFGATLRRRSTTRHAPRRRA